MAESEIEVRLANGRRLTARHDAGRPAADLAAQGDRVTEKFKSLVAPVLGAQRSDDIIEQVERLEGLPRIDRVMRMTLNGLQTQASD